MIVDATEPIGRETIESSSVRRWRRWATPGRSIESGPAVDGEPSRCSRRLALAPHQGTSTRPSINRRALRRMIARRAVQPASAGTTSAPTSSTPAG